MASTETLIPSSRAAVEERRTSTRTRANIAMNLTPLGEARMHDCSAEDISAGGVFVCLPPDYSLKVGQRVEVVLKDTVKSHLRPGLTGEARYATVVRTQRLAGHAQNVMGAGLRFDRAVFLDAHTAAPRVHP